MADLLSTARVRPRYFATRFQLTASALEYNVAANTHLFKSANAESTNYDATYGLDNGERFNLEIETEDSPCWLQLSSTSNDRIYLKAGIPKQIYVTRFSNIYLTPAAATVAQIDRVVYTNELGTKNLDTFNFADKASTGAGDYFVVYDTAGLGWAISLDTTGTDPEPTGAIWTAIPAARKDHVDISGVSNDEDIAALVETAINALTGFSDKFTTDDTAADGTMTITNDQMGPVTNAVVKNEDDSGAGSIAVTQTTAGVASNHNNTYITLFAKNNTTGAETVYGVWYNVNSEGTEPTDSNVDVWVPVAFAAGATAATIGAAAEIAIDALTGVFTSDDSVAGTLNITHSAAGTRNNAVDNSSPDTVSTPTEGEGTASNVSILVS